MIPYGRQHLDEDDVKAVVETLTSNWLTQGPAIPKFETALADYCGANFGIAVNSATSALHIACLALGVSEGDRVWTSPNSFVASSNCALYCGAKVDFVDIDLHTGNMCVDALRNKLALAESTNALPKVVIPVHFAGQPCDMKEIRALSKEYGFLVIEDASHAVGAKYQEKFVGSCEFSDICVFSFHPVKIITTMEGGMALTNNSEWAEKMRMLRSHGITNDPEKMTEDSHGPWYYQQIALGFNYRMTNMQGAIGMAQLERFDEILETRRKQEDFYLNLLNDNKKFSLRPQQAWSESIHWLMTIKLNIPGIRDILLERLREKGVDCRQMIFPVHEAKHFKSNYSSEDYPVSVKVSHNSLHLPSSTKLTTEQIEWIVENLYKSLKEII